MNCRRRFETICTCEQCPWRHGRGGQEKPTDLITHFSVWNSFACWRRTARCSKEASTTVSGKTNGDPFKSFFFFLNPHSAIDFIFIFFQILNHSMIGILGFHLLFSWWELARRMWRFPFRSIPQLNGFFRMGFHWFNLLLWHYNFSLNLSNTQKKKKKFKHPPIYDGTTFDPAACWWVFKLKNKEEKGSHTHTHTKMKRTPKSWSASLPRSTTRRALGRIVATPPVLLRRQRWRSSSHLYTTTPTFDSDNFATDSASLLQSLTDEPNLIFSSSESSESSSMAGTQSALNPVLLNSRWSTGSFGPTTCLFHVVGSVYRFQRPVQRNVLSWIRWKTSEIENKFLKFSFLYIKKKKN